MSFEQDLLYGVAELLDTAGAGRWSLTDPYVDTDVAITIDSTPSAPDRAIALTTYPVEDHGILTDSIVAVQLRIRGRPGNVRDTKETSSTAFDALQGLTNTSIGGIPIVRAWRQSGANLGPDQANRQETTANYYFQLIRTSPNRHD